MNPRVIQARFGGKLISDPYPFITPDGDLWLSLLAKSTTKSINLYATLVRIRAVGAKLDKHKTLGYCITPIIRDAKNKWGFPSQQEWNEEKKNMLPYLEDIKVMLKELENESKKIASTVT